MSLGFILLLFCLVLGATVILVVTLQKKDRIAFHEICQKGTALVVGYDRERGSSCADLMVRIRELNDGKLYNCKGPGIRVADYPICSTIPVVYAKMRVLGIPVIEVYLDSDRIVQERN